MYFASMAARADVDADLAHAVDWASSSTSQVGLYAASDVQLRPLLQYMLTARLGMLLKDQQRSLSCFNCSSCWF